MVWHGAWRDRTSRHGFPVVLLIVATTLAGCSGDDEADELPSFGGSTSGPTSTAPETATETAVEPTGSSGPTPSPSTSAALEGADQVTVDVAAPPGDAAEVFTAYVEFWQADVTALAKSDPDWKPLLDRVSGVQRSDTVALLRANQAKKQTVTGSITIRPQILVARGDAATVRDCLDLSRSHAVNRAGRTVAGTRGPDAIAYAVAMVRKGSQWTVSNIDVVKDPTCR